MPRRFKPGETPPTPYPLGLIGPASMDPHHMPFVTRVLDKVTYRLGNVAVLAHGLRERLSYSMIGGIEEIARYYAGRHWYDVLLFRQFIPAKFNGKTVPYDPQFFQQAKAFVVFDDGASVEVKYHTRLAAETKKRYQVFKLKENW